MSLCLHKDIEKSIRCERNNDLCCQISIYKSSNDTLHSFDTLRNLEKTCKLSSETLYRYFKRSNQYIDGFLQEQRQHYVSNTYNLCGQKLELQIIAAGHKLQQEMHCMNLDNYEPPKEDQGRAIGE
jgi:hypothetical protein